MAPAGSDVRGIGPMVAIELPEQTGDETTRITAEAREQGLLLLSCGIYGNVIRILVPFTIGDDELEKGSTSWRAALAADVGVEGSVRPTATSLPSTTST